MMKEKYNKEVVPALMEKFQYKNKNQAPKIEKVVVNVGFGREAISRGGDDLKKFISGIVEDLSLITGQKPSLRNSKKSIAGFKLRKGIPIGAKVTLRGQRMYDFLDRLVNVALPRSRDFRGLDTKHFDKDGNFSIGIKEHIIFPEVSAEKMKNIFGFEVTVRIKTNSKEEGIELLRLLGFPIKK
ncbi:MAG: 50S ribosomal protein L5 [Parcubacteria group bacterium ADurb.Bin247]|nr:MAG: 50S ribosomal protein L5 [Parcubacteria group bacterium ADurb.Bin247]HQB85230.1 50S ribosomal protein L5 [Candidatus Pacearchaeota archaeon]